jgi:hypothetical protein
MSVPQIKKRLPLAAKHLDQVSDVAIGGFVSKHRWPFPKVRELFDKFDENKDDSLSINEVAELFQEISNKATALPAVGLPFAFDCISPTFRNLPLQTAQVASQQGHYLGKKLSKLARAHDTLIANDIYDMDEAVSDPFKYRHLGSLAYIGNAAVFDFGKFSFMGGLVSQVSVYLAARVSSRDY